jgi:hypothetical protein
MRHHSDEEVGSEKGPENHHLGDDEKQHAQDRGLDPRRAMGGRRTVVFGVAY